MKLSHLTFMICALTAAVVSSGCGKSQDENKTNVVSNAIPVAPAGGMPQGCYNTGYQTCAPCPNGYAASNGTCVVNGAGGVGSCAYGQTWNGSACGAPTGYNNCSGMSGTWSQQYGGCMTSAQGNYPGYRCMPYGYAYICYYTYGAPSSGYYYNGYGWMRF